MAGHGCSWVVASKSWLVVGGRGWSYDLVMPIFNMACASTCE